MALSFTPHFSASVSLRLIGLLGVVWVGCGIAFPLAAKEEPPVRMRPDPVGRLEANRYLTPTGQILTPAGRQVELPGLRPQALALSPDGKWLVTSGKTNGLIVIDATKGLIT